jgi:hypothetical protein
MCGGNIAVVKLLKDDDATNSAAGALWSLSYENSKILIKMLFVKQMVSYH